MFARVLVGVTEHLAVQNGVLDGTQTIVAGDFGAGQVHVARDASRVVFRVRPDRAHASRRGVRVTREYRDAVGHGRNVDAVFANNRDAHVSSLVV